MEVYTKILNGEFAIAYPEVSKTSGKKSAVCWNQGMRLVVVKGTESEWFLTG